jgi:hypothetical protein
LWLKHYVLQVQAFAEFGDLPANVDLIVLQQLPHSMAHNFIQVSIRPNPAISIA